MKTEAKTLLIYALHSGNLYGTERMALTTAAGLRADFDAVILAPPGPVHDEARRLGFAAHAFTSSRDFICTLFTMLARPCRIAFVATSVVQSFAFAALNLVCRRAAAHIHVVHGGTDEQLSYARKRWLAPLGIKLTAVSAFVKERLQAHGVAPADIVVIENFLAPERLQALAQRVPFVANGIRRALVVARVDPIKRVDLLLDAFDLEPALQQLPVRVCGTGWQLEELKARAAERNPNVTFAGFIADIEAELAATDLLIHTCAEEPFGLAILEAMAARVPVLAPDAGGAGALITNGISGFHFRANDVRALADQLLRLLQADADELNRVVAGGSAALATRFSPAARLADYRNLLRIS